MAHSFKWEKQTGKHQTGEWLRVGRVVIGSAFYDGTGPSGDPNKYAVDCLLPGIKRAADRYDTLDAAKERLERMARAWLSWIEQDQD